MDDKGENTAGRDPANIANDAMSRNSVSARTPANLARPADDIDELGSQDRHVPSSASEKARRLPGRMLVIVWAGLFTWMVIAIGLMFLVG